MIGQGRAALRFCWHSLPLLLCLMLSLLLGSSDMFGHPLIPALGQQLERACKLLASLGCLFRATVEIHGLFLEGVYKFEVCFPLKNILHQKLTKDSGLGALRGLSSQLFTRGSLSEKPPKTSKHSAKRVQTSKPQLSPAVLCQLNHGNRNSTMPDNI